MMQRDEKQTVVRVLEDVKKRLQNKYKIAAERQNPGAHRPSGWMGGLNEAIAEIQKVLDDLRVDPVPPEPAPLSVMESQTDIGHGVILQSWFTRTGTTITRSEVYLLSDGYVVAYQDCVNGVWDPLQMEKHFCIQYAEEDELKTILKYAGVTTLSKVCTFDAGR